MKNFISLLLLSLATFCMVGESHAQPVLLLSEGFETPGAPGLPTGWTTTTARVPAGDWQDSALSSNPQGSRCCYNINATVQQILTSPAVNFTGYTSDSVVFFARRSSSFNAILSIEVSTNSGSTWTIIDTLSGSIPTSSPFKRYAFLIPSIVNGQSNVIFRYRNQGNGTGSAGTTRLDSFAVYGLSSVLNDGAGTATIDNNTGTLTGSDIFNRNAASQSVTVSVTGVIAGNLDKVKLTVPASWGTYSTANVSVGGAFTGKVPAFSGRDIQINSAALGTTAGTITITGLTSPNPNTAGANGNDTWVVQTAKPLGTLTNIASSPVSYTIIPVQNLRTGGTDGFGNSDAGGTTPVLNNNTVAVQGTITVPNRVLAETTSTSIIIQDGSYGIQIFRSSTDSHNSLLLGNQIIVKGLVTVFNGNTEITPASVSSPDLFNLGGSSVPAATVIAGAAAISEANEGKLVQVNSVAWDSAGSTFVALADNVGKNNFTTTVGADSGTMYLHAANDLVGNTIPATSNIVGIVYHRTDLTGAGQRPYKIAPRNQIDLGFDPADGTGTATVTPAGRLQSQSAVPETLVIAGDGSHTISGASVTIPSSWTWPTGDTAHVKLSGAGFTGSTKTVSGDGSGGNPWVITIGSTAVTNTNTGKVVITNLTTPAALGGTTFIVKTKGSTGSLTPIASSPIVTIASSYEATGSGNWSSPDTWAGGVVPTSSSDVTMTTLGVTVTIDINNAVCNSLTMTGTGSVSNSGPLLQFDATGAKQLTINNDLSITGGAGSTGDRAGRPKLTSNGNASATLIVKGSITTTSSNSSSNGNAGLNMNEGTVKLTGSTTDSVYNGASYRLANLEIGDGSTTKTVVLSPTGTSSTLYIRSLRVRTNGTFWIGTGGGTNPSTIGNAGSSGYPYLDGGITVDIGGALRVQSFGSGQDTTKLHIDSLGITNNGTIDFSVGALSTTSSHKVDGGKSASAVTNCFVTTSFGGLSGGSSNSRHVISGNQVGQFANITVAAGDTLELQQDVSIPSPFTMTMNGTLIESAGNTVLGSVEAMRVVPQSTNESFGGIGLTINAAGGVPDTTTVVRTTNSAQSGGGHTSILRYFDITPKNNASLNATLDFYYDNSELAGQTASTLSLWKSTDGGSTWQLQGGTADAGNRKIHLTGVNSFSRWTAADAANALGNASSEFAVGKGWNMISVALTVPDYTKTVLYPTSTTDAFKYSGGYQAEAVLQNGPGYWLKFGADQLVSMAGAARPTDSITVVAGWNLIGSVSNPVPVSTIGEVPPNNVVSSFYRFQSGYQGADSIMPGQGYWVKTNNDGKLALTSSGLMKSGESPMQRLKELNSLTITDNNGGSQTLYFGSSNNEDFRINQYEMPPLPPTGAFDTRFASQRMAELIPEHITDAKEYTIQLSSPAYPINVKWDLGNGADVKKSYLLEVRNRGKVEHEFNLRTSNNIRIQGNGDNTLVLKVSNVDVPKEFALSQNYPNPFNPSTRVTVAVPKNAFVDVTIYDILGRKIVTLYSGDLAAGYHAMEWNGTGNYGEGVAGGVYFLKMTSGSFSSSKKLLLMK